MPHPYILHASLAVGLIPGLLGMKALVNPASVMQSAKFPEPAQPEAKKLAHALMRLYGVRNIFVSFLLATVWSTRDERLMGTGMIGALFMCISDGLISQSLIGGGVLKHWSIAPVIVGLMGGLFEWYKS